MAVNDTNIIHVMIIKRLCMVRNTLLLIYTLDKKIVELYESAVKSYPTNEEFLTQLFMAYVRVGDCAKQQQVNN